MKNFQPRRQAGTKPRQGDPVRSAQEKTLRVGVIDVAIMQSLTSDWDVKELGKDYGMAVVDDVTMFR